MSFKLKAFGVVVLILVIAYVFFGCGRKTSQPVIDNSATPVAQPLQW